MINKSLIRHYLDKVYLDHKTMSIKFHNKYPYYTPVFYYILFNFFVNIFRQILGAIAYNVPAVYEIRNFAGNTYVGTWRARDNSLPCKDLALLVW
jgi:hypothetical protein